MRKVTTVVLAWGVLAVFAAGPAAAHSGIMPSRMAPATTEDAELLVVHGCGEDGTVPGSDDPTFATTAITLDVPTGVGVVPATADGWEMATEVDGDGRVVTVRWDSVDPAGTFDTISFDLEVTTPDVSDDTQVWIPVVQDCTDGEQMAWTHAGTDSADGVHPATLLTVGELPGAASNSGGGLPTSVIITLALALGVLAGGGVFLVSGRRS